MLPRLWALCERDWMALRDCRRQDNADLPMPYEAPPLVTSSPNYNTQRPDYPKTQLPDYLMTYYLITYALRGAARPPL